MKSKLLISVITMGLHVISTSAQVAENKSIEKPSVKISGYVRTESIFDSYLNTESRDGEISFYPKRESPDVDGNDRNKVGQFNLLGLQSRFKIGISGGSAFGAILSGAIEADFLGSCDAYKYNLRLRHAFIKMDWKKTQLLVGQFWHPVTIAELAPNTVVFGAGMVFHPLNRPAQIRVTQQISKVLKVMGAISSYTLHRSIEPTGTNSQRNSGLPDFTLQGQLGNTKSVFFSVAAGYKFLKPYLITPINNDTAYAATKIIGSYYLSGTFGYSMPALSFKFQGNYGENLTGFCMIGGYAPVAGSMNSKGEYDYTNMKTLALWADIETNGSKVKFGLFAGYTKNMGTDKDVDLNAEYKTDITIINELSRDKDLESVYRFAPRVYFIQGPIDIGLEYSLTGADYGTFFGKKIVDVNDKSINHRIMMAVRYTF